MFRTIAFGFAALLAASVASAQTPSSKDIIDTAVGAGSFTTLAKALQAADLVVTLIGPGPFTVFAPTVDAFAKLRNSALDDLLKPENKAKLRRVLTAHVVSGRVTSSEVVKLKSAKAVSGDTLTVAANGSKVMVATATVVKTDIPASNGVIHVIDSVIVPAN
jgi:uncharacterized surface protein with fasciclin (FAS1) repeats